MPVDPPAMESTPVDPPSEVLAYVSNADGVDPSDNTEPPGVPEIL